MDRRPYKGQAVMSNKGSLPERKLWNPLFLRHVGDHHDDRNDPAALTIAFAFLDHGS